MEINTEINKVFGEEMAKLFAAQISEEELMSKAREVWKAINYKDTSYWSSNKQSELEKEISNEYLRRVHAAADAILESEEGQISIQTAAQELVKKIRAKAEEEIVSRAANIIASMYCGDNICHRNIQDVIADTVYTMTPKGN